MKKLNYLFFQQILYYYLSPIVVVPPFLSSKLYFTLLNYESEVNNKCTTKYLDWEELWNAKSLDYECFAEYLKLKYIKEKKMFKFPKGIQSGVRNSTSFDTMVNHDSFIQTTDFLEYFTQKGQIENKSIAMAPFDWRFDQLQYEKEIDPDRDSFTSEFKGSIGYQNRLKQIIENLQNINNNSKVTVVGLSQGGLVGLYFISNQVDEVWLEKQVENWISWGAPQGGSVIPIASLVSSFQTLMFYVHKKIELNINKNKELTSIKERMVRWFNYIQNMQFDKLIDDLVIQFNDQFNTKGRIHDMNENFIKLKRNLLYNLPAIVQMIPCKEIVEDKILIQDDFKSQNIINFEELLSEIEAINLLDQQKEIVSSKRHICNQDFVKYSLKIKNHAIVGTGQPTQTRYVFKGKFDKSYIKQPDQALDQQDGDGTVLLSSQMQFQKQKNSNSVKLVTLKNHEHSEWGKKEALDYIQSVSYNVENKVIQNINPVIPNNVDKNYNGNDDDNEEENKSDDINNARNKMIKLSNRHLSNNIYKNMQIQIIKVKLKSKTKTK